LGGAYTSDVAYDPAVVRTQAEIEAIGEEEGLAYEDAYGDQNFSPLLGTNPETQSTLDELYGNIDTSSDLEPSTLDEVYGAAGSSSAVRTPEEIAAILAATQSGTPIGADEDRTGIRGVEDDDAPIEPIV
jgi:hypothetical protein